MNHRIRISAQQLSKKELSLFLEKDISFSLYCSFIRKPAFLAGHSAPDVFILLYLTLPYQQRTRFEAGEQLQYL